MLFDFGVLVGVLVRRRLLGACHGWGWSMRWVGCMTGVKLLAGGSLKCDMWDKCAALICTYATAGKRSRNPCALLSGMVPVLCALTRLSLPLLLQLILYVFKARAVMLASFESALVRTCMMVQVVGSSYQVLDTPNPATYIGSGKVAEVARTIKMYKVC